jgi:hypothetical protein
LQVAVTPGLLLSLLVLTLGSGFGFIVVIVANLGTGIGLHELAESLLLGLLVSSLALSYRIRSVDEAPMIRVAIALVALVVAGVLGGALAAGQFSGANAGLPLVPLVVMLGAVADGIRVTLNVQPRSDAGGRDPGRLAKP